MTGPSARYDLNSVFFFSLTLHPCLNILQEADSNEVLILFFFQLLYNPQMNQVISGCTEGILKVEYMIIIIINKIYLSLLRSINMMNCTSSVGK